MARQEGAATHGPFCAASTRCRADGRGRLGARRLARAGAGRRLDRDGAGRRGEPGGVLHRGGVAADSSEPRDGLHAEHGRGLGLDGARRARAARRSLHRLRRVGDGNRRGLRRDQARSRRGDALRRQRGGSDTARGRRLCRNARPLPPQRRPRPGEPSLRRRPRRLRDGRGRRRARARGARARARARGQGVRGARGLRRQLGCLPHDRARSGRCRAGSRHPRGARRRGTRARRRRLRQCACELDRPR